MKTNKKLSLNELTVESFVTSLNSIKSQTIKSGINTSVTCGTGNVAGTGAVDGVTLINYVAEKLTKKNVGGGKPAEAKVDECDEDYTVNADCECEGSYAMCTASPNGPCVPTNPAQCI